MKMSFTLQTKNALLDKKPKNSCCIHAFLSGIISFGGNISICGNEAVYRISSENKRLTENLRDIIEKLFVLRTEIIQTSSKSKLIVRDAQIMLHELGIIEWGDVSCRIPDTLTSECCIRAYIAGAFIGGGSIMSPEKSYHLEFVTAHYSVSRSFTELFDKFDIPAKTLMRKSKYVTYFKDNEIICDVLALMGAVDAVLEVSTTNMEKSVNNQSNRIWNFENANLDKTIEASFKQAAAIEKIGIENLPENLKETARLRIANKELNLTQLGQLFDPPLSKSAVNHKMRKIMEIANLK